MPGGHSCEHEHNEHGHVGPETGIEYSLYTKIDTDNLECLNEHSDGAGRTVFKPWEDRLKRDKVCWCIIMICMYRSQFIFPFPVLTLILIFFSSMLTVMLMKNSCLTSREFPILSLSNTWKTQCLCHRHYVLSVCRFTGNVKLKGIVLIGGEGEMHPSKMRLWVLTIYTCFTLLFYISYNIKLCLMPIQLQKSSKNVIWWHSSCSWARVWT